jgi:hypothetical protein
MNPYSLRYQGSFKLVRKGSYSVNWNRARFSFLLLTGVLILPFLGIWGTSTSAAPVSDTSFALTLQHDHLSAAINNLPLRVVLEKLSRLMNLEVSLEKSVGDETITVEYKNLPLEEAIRRILHGKSYALTYAQTSFSKGHTALPKVVGIRVVPKGAGPSTVQGNTDSETIYFGGFGGNEPDRQRNAEQEQAHDSLAAADTKARLAALTEGAEDKKAEALRAIVAGLEDENADVREAALDVLKSGYGPVPLKPLSEVALKDGSPAHRTDALMLLAERNGQAALGPLNQALKDPDPGVSEMAHTLIETLMEENR